MARPGSDSDPNYVREATPLAVVNNGGQTAAAAVANTVVADTGALPAGTYEVEVEGGILGALTAGVGLVIEHRNAANGANIAVLGGGVQFERRIKRVTVALNERIRIRTDAVALPAATVAAAAIRVYQIAA